MREKHGFDSGRLARLFSQAQPQPKALKAIMPPADPSVRSWQAYRARFIEPSRIEGGLRFWEANGQTLDAAQSTYGVPGEIIVAIIGIETIYGRNAGKFPAFATLATLAFDYPPRAELFRSELEALLLLARDSRRNPLTYTGSYAGALGIPQFLPSSIRNWGVDFDGDGQVDLAASTIDAIGSVANFLASHGWETGSPIAAPASVAGDRFGELINAGILPRFLPAGNDGLWGQSGGRCTATALRPDRPRAPPTRQPNTGWDTATSTSSRATTAQAFMRWRYMRCRGN